jgi:hypothetical protein
MIKMTFVCPHCNKSHEFDVTHEYQGKFTSYYCNNTESWIYLDCPRVLSGEEVNKNNEHR